MNFQSYIERAIQKNQLKLNEGDRRWRKYFISITELVWARNFVDGYQIDIYRDNIKREFLERIII